MSSLMTSLGIDRLSAAEQLQLVGEILDHFDRDREPPPLTEAQRHDLDRRLAALEANPSAVSSWDEVETRVLARLHSEPAGDDELLRELLESNTAFQDLVAKSKASPRKPFAADSGA